MRARLIGANLSGANLSNARLLGVILVNNKYEKSINKNTNFDNAIIDNPEYIKYLHNNGGLNIPNEINNKQELRSLLEKRKLTVIDKDDDVNYILSISDLQWEEKEKQEDR